MFETEDLEKKVEAIDYDTRLLITEWVMKHVVEHAKESGSYRYLIYDRLGFGPDAYAVLLHDGMTISNEFDIQQHGAIVKAVVDNKIDVLKPLVGLCDEPNCFKHASVGHPTETGYRHTCFDHSGLKKKVDNETQ